MKNPINSDFFVGNRQAIIDSLGGGALIALPAYSAMQRRADVAFKFEQEANFWYLSGINEPDWWLIISGKQHRTWLVRPDENRIKDLFDGSLSSEQALKISGADTVIDKTEARQLLAKLKTYHSVVHSLSLETQQKRYGHYGFTLNPAHKQFAEVISKFNVRDIQKELARLRAIKQPAEITAIKQAVKISISGIKEALGELKNLKHEYEFEAVLSRAFRQIGADGHAYDPIVAAGKNACVLHYSANNALLSKKDWLLFDAAASVLGYSADITRSIPLGKPNNFNLAVYEANKRVYDYAVSLCTPNQRLDTYQELVDQKMTDELLNLKIIKNPDELRKYFPHAVSHGLGIDVHEGLGGFGTFQPGMVLTVEPGIYIAEKNFGVRLEDDILITEFKPQVLSAALPTDIEALQKLL